MLHGEAVSGSGKGRDDAYNLYSGPILPETALVARFLTIAVLSGLNSS